MDWLDGVLSAHSISSTIDQWAFSVLNHEQRNRLRDCRVLWMEHRKNREGSMHEYIQVAVLCTIHSTPCFRFIRIDRSFQRNPPHTQDHHRPLLRGRSLPADDTLMISSTPHLAGSFSVYVMHFDFAVAPSILDLAIVLSAVTSAAPVYNLETMCYWYARMVFESTAESFNGRVEPGQCPELRGRFTRGIRLVEKDGKFCLAILAYVPWIKRSLVALPTRLDLLSEVTHLREELERAWYCAESAEATGDAELIATAGESLTVEQLEDSEVRVIFRRLTHRS